MDNDPITSGNPAGMGGAPNASTGPGDLANNSEATNTNNTENMANEVSPSGIVNASEPNPNVGQSASTMSQNNVSGVSGQPASNIPNWMSDNHAISDLPHGSVVEPANAPKKKHTGLIVTLVVLLLLVLGGAGAGVWFFGVHSDPEKVVLDAVTGFLQKKNISVSASGLYQQEYSGSSSSKTSLTYAINSKATGLSGSTGGSIVVSHEEDGKDDVSLKVDVGGVMMSDGVFYVQVDNLKESFEQYMDYEGVTTEEAGPTVEMISDIIQEVDGEWWEISVPDLLDEVAGSEGSNEPVKHFYTCMVDVAKESTSKTQEIVDIYKSNRFVEAQKIGRQLPNNSGKLGFGKNYYEVSLNPEKLASFVNSIRRSSIAEETFKCINAYTKEQYDQYNKEYNEYYQQLETDCLEAGYDATDCAMMVPSSAYKEPEEYSIDDVEDIEAEDIERYLDDSTSYYLMISDFTHELQGVAYISKDKEEEPNPTFDVPTYTRTSKEDYSGIWTFDYSNVTIEAPKEYRPITELVSKVTQIIQEYQDMAYSSLGDDWDFGDETDDLEI